MYVEREKEITIVGIDWSRESHMCWFLLDGKCIKITDDEKGYEILLERAGEDAVFVIEEGYNRITAYLLDMGRVVYVLPPGRSKSSRKYHGNGNKNDKLDAKVIALTYKEHPEYCMKMRKNELATELRTLLFEYEQLTMSMSQQLNRLNNDLYNHYPEYLRTMGKSYSNPRGLALLSLAPSFEKLSLLKDKEIVSGMKNLGVRLTSNFREKLKLLRENGVVRKEFSWTDKMISFNAHQLLEMKLLKTEMTKDMSRKLLNSDYGIILGIPGVGPVVGAEIVISYLSHEFKTYRDLQRYAGTTPVVYQSGNYSSCHMRRNCNHRLKGHLHMGLTAGMSHSKWMKAYYDKKKKKEGKSNAHALRALANTILKIAFAMLKNLNPYDEKVFLSARKPHSNYTSSNKLKIVRYPVRSCPESENSHCQAFSPPD